jgi:hypothetical protein
MDALAMADQLPGWARATIDRMNEQPEKARSLLARAGWPQIGEAFDVEHAGGCTTCGHPLIDVIEHAEGDAPVSLVTSGCLVCDVFEEVDLDSVHLVEPEDIPVSDGSADEDNGEPR